MPVEASGKEIEGAAGHATNRPWEVFRPAKPSDPWNPVRYQSTVRLAIALAVLAVAVTLIMFPARMAEVDFSAIVSEARAAGIPQIPPAYATPDEMAKFREEWQISCSGVANGMPLCEYLSELSGLHGEYEERAAIIAVGLMALTGAALLTAAFAFSRALNNLHALGHEPSPIPPAWSFAGFLIPVVNLVLPWRVLDEVWRAAWSRLDVLDGRIERSRPSVVIAAWGIVAIVTAALNPVVVSRLFQRADISGWATHLEWVAVSITWLPAPVVLTALLLAVVTWRQRRRITVLENWARTQRIAGTSAM